MKNKVLSYEWETLLEYQMLSHNRCKKKAYICSPLGADNSAKLLDNIHSARAYMLYAASKLNVIARAPHAYLPPLLCEDIPAERALALEFGIKLLEQSEVLFVCGSNLSMGMKTEIAKAAALHMKIITFDKDMLIAARKIVTANGGTKKLVSYDSNHPILASSNPVCSEGGDRAWSDFINQLTCARAKL